MADIAGSRAQANDATVDAVENEPSPEQKLRRARADVAMCQRVVDELVEGQTQADRKAADVEKIYKAKQAEVKRMVTAAKRALREAEVALTEMEGES